MSIEHALKKIKTVRIHPNAPLVAETAAREICNRIGSRLVRSGDSGLKEGVFILAVAGDDTVSHPAETDVEIKLESDGSGYLSVSKACFLFTYTCYLLERLVNEDLSLFKSGKRFKCAYKWHRSSYDYFIAQEGRIQRHMDKDLYFRTLAKHGFTHCEINGLAYPMGIEEDRKGESYAMFYTYCAALDQFVYSELNKGLYPSCYLSANLQNLLENAQLAAQYGLIPGMLCFEPRSVPEHFFDRYPMLRGARVDHPFRSFKPRYTMTLAHPKVQDHYAEMMQKIMHHVPELGFITIWTNDSGAGFEYTQSLYVGRNGGPYLIREWKTEKDIAEAAAANILNFFQVLKTAAATVNPQFRVITRMESFYGEHDQIWNGLGNGLDVETNSLVSRGWAMPYHHPRYTDVSDINGGSIYQAQFDEKEEEKIKALRKKEAGAHFYMTAGPHLLFEPLMGIPYPRLCLKRVKMLRNHGVEHLARSGGIHPPNLVPFDINSALLGHYQINPEMEPEAELAFFARRWAGDGYYQSLLDAWTETEEAILAFPNVTAMYTGLGFTWFRLWARPLIPNLDAVSPRDRAYYEDFMCTTPHNTNNVDLSRDVLFKLTTAGHCKKTIERMDSKLWPHIDKAIDILQQVIEDAKITDPQNIFYDQLIRCKALKCWFVTQKNIATWIYAVHSYMHTVDETARERFRTLLKEMINAEIENSRTLQLLWNSGVEFMIVTDKGETPEVYGDNLPDLLNKRIKLMRKHINDEPYIDPDYMMRKAGEMLK
ncbi:hypothetical protein GF407_11885 [candidate division KSB1 bacterium]|nr:hypothetical protein [candidate division KSB1 bacterium]